jgi:hypothetical protein
MFRNVLLCYKQLLLLNITVKCYLSHGFWVTHGYFSDDAFNDF